MISNRGTEPSTAERALERRTGIADRLMEEHRKRLCGVVIHSHWHEPVACAYRPDHEGEHSWSGLPAFDPMQRIAELEHEVYELDNLRR